MSSSRALPLGLLLAASSLSAQVIISGAGGVANETYSDAIDTTGGNTLWLEFMIDYLVVGGGGAGGTAGGGGGENTWGAGGGGAGGVKSGQFSFFGGPVLVKVGAGGTARGYVDGSTFNGNSGGDSYINSEEIYDVALGGGGGAGSNNSATGGVGLDGASGGGGGGDGLKAGGAGTLDQGFGGGTSRTSAGNRAAGGGGGGAGGVGQIGGPPNGHSSGIGGNGGAGIASNIRGSSVFYGGGGGGGGRDINSGSTSAGGTGGTGGGGAGSGQGNATSGTNGFGGGGGGSGADGQGGNGGHGTVIVRYKGEAAGTGGTVTTGTGSAAGYTIHTFSTVGEDALDLSTINPNTRLGAKVSSAVTGSGALNISTPGTIVYTGSASHTGGTNVLSGRFEVGDGDTNGALGSSDIAISSGATLAFNGQNVVLANKISGAGNLVKMYGNSVTLSGDFSGLTGNIQVTTGDLVLSNAVGQTYTVSATTSGQGNLVKSGDGTVILTGNLAHGAVGVFGGGTTFVTGGKLVVNGIHDGYVSVESATLGGSGTIKKAGAFQNSIHTPGNSPGIQTFEGGLTYWNTQIQWELGANTDSNSPAVSFDQIISGDGLWFGGASTIALSFNPVTTGGTVDWSDAFWTSDRSWTIFDVTGATSGFGSLSIFEQDWLDAQGDAFSTALAGASFSLSQVGSDIVLNYTAAAIPEPSTYGLILGGLALAGAALRRRKQIK